MDEAIRNQAFLWLTEQVSLHGDVLNREILSKGFIFNDQRINLVGGQGIWKPKSCIYPISITTSPNSPYKDSWDKEKDLLIYSYRKEGFDFWINKLLRNAYKNKIPLIYFHGITEGKYLATWPVYVIEDNPKNETFTIAVDDLNQIKYGANNMISGEEMDILRRRYITAITKVRLHQRIFRERVVEAYRTQCALCSLKHNELLDAAHIIPDAEELGEPVISNGLSLCKIHHAAYDKFIIGITPDYVIKVRQDVLEEIDGPMLKYGIQSLEGKPLILPIKKQNLPDQEKLSIRYEIFKNKVA